MSDLFSFNGSILFLKTEWFYGSQHSKKGFHRFVIPLAAPNSERWKKKSPANIQRNECWKNAKILPKMFYMKGNQYRILTTCFIRTVRFLVTAKERRKSTHCSCITFCTHSINNKMTTLGCFEFYQNFTLLLSKPKMIDLSPFFRENIYPLNHT